MPDRLTHTLPASAIPDSMGFYSQALTRSRQCATTALVMNQAFASAASPHRQRQARQFAPALLAALATLALIGCPASTPINLPVFSDEVRDLNFQAGQTIRPVELPPATGGNGTLSYSLRPEVPGLTFDRLSRTLSGTPTTAGSYSMTYEARDQNLKTARLLFDINVAQSSPIGSILSAVAVGDAAGVLRLADMPEPGGGPAVSVSGNRILVAGGSIFLDVAPVAGATAEKLLISLGGESSGYYEIDLPRPASSYRLVGQVPFSFDPAADRTCIAVTAVDRNGASGPVDCFTVIMRHEGAGLPVASGDVEVTLSWDSDADLDLHVADPTGAEVFYGSTVVDSGGVLDLEAGYPCGGDIVRNEHTAWALGSPPPGIYEVRVSHYLSCEAPETNYVVSIYNHGRRTTFSGTFTGSGGNSARGTGRVIAQFEVAGDGTPPRRPNSLSFTYRGSGDQVFVLNPDGEVLDDTVYSLHLGDSSPEVYVIATAGNRHMEHRVELLDRRKATAQDRAAVQDGQPASRPAAGEVSPRLQRITAFNNFNDGPPVWEGSADPAHSQAVGARPAVAVGDRVSFFDLVDEVLVPATVRRVVTDGSTSVALWVADREWADTCASRGDCVTGEMVNAVADRFLRSGSSNDIYDWVSTIFGDPWGPHDVPVLIPPEAGGEIHIFLFDIENDGYPTGPRIVGYFSRLHNLLRQPDHPLIQYSLERLAFFLDSPWLATAEGDSWEVTDRRPSVILGTLAHEFQHMIHYYQKPVVRGAISETWLNEQASEVAEDLVADKLMIDGPRAVAYHDPGAGEPENRSGRLPGYNLYNDIQVSAWDGYLANYSINYAFGAYLARNYGGAALFSDIVQSDRHGVGAIEGAVRNQDHDESFLDLLTNWGAANLLSDNTAAPAPYQYNTGTWRTSHTGGTEFRLGSINLYNYVYAPGRLARPGPYLHPLATFNDLTQPPHSNRYTTLGRNSGTIRLRVSAPSDSRITVVVKA